MTHHDISTALTLAAAVGDDQRQNAETIAWPTSAEPAVLAPRDDLPAEAGQLAADINDVFASMNVAEQEIENAQLRHGETPPRRDPTGSVIDVPGRLWHSFLLLQPTGDMANKAEFVHRAHCRELLDRRAHDQDTRPGTDAEMLLALAKVSLATPLHGSVFGLYMRLFSRCFPDLSATDFADIRQTLEAYERMYGTEIDEHETWLRHRARQEWRTPRDAAPAKRPARDAHEALPAANQTTLAIEFD